MKIKRLTSDMVAHSIAEKASSVGGRAFFVGGYVRDKLNNIASEDIDIEVYNIKKDILLSILSCFGNVNTVGGKFGIFTLTDYNIDVALPREENYTGNGHKDLIVNVNENLSYREALRRRDFTINAMLMDILTNEVVDEYGGINDLHNKILRHIDKDFSLDSLRVLRACQFASRFEYIIADETIELCKSVDIIYLSKERVEGEMQKALLKAKKPSIFFYYLKKMGKLDFWFSEIGELVGLKQDKIYHPEGDVFTHTMEVLDRGAILRDKADNPYYFMMLCLTHDFGKILTTKEENGRIHSYNHEIVGREKIESFVKRISNDKNLLKYLNSLVPLHMKPNVVAKNNSKAKVTNKMFDEAISKKDLMLFAYADVKQCDDSVKVFLENRYKLYLGTMSKPYVTGDDLIENGIIKSEDIKHYLEFSHKLRLTGESKENILKQILSDKNKRRL